MVQTQRPKSTTGWVLAAMAAPFFMIVQIMVQVANDAGALSPFVLTVCTGAAVLGFIKGSKPGPHGAGWGALTVLLIFATLPLLAFGAGFLLVRSSKGQSKPAASTEVAVTNDRTEVLASPHPSRQIVAVASKGWSKPGGGHVGWDDTGRYVGANARGAMLVIGPPGSGKSMAVIIPSILVMPAAGVVVSIKLDLLLATAYSRGAVGTVFHLDFGGGEETPAGVVQARWSPLVAIRTWDDARMIATRIAAPMMGQEKASGESDNHFMERGRDWIEVLLYAAHLGGHDISTVADWVQIPDSGEVTEEVDSLLIYAASNGDRGAKIAAGQHAGLLQIPDRERGSIKSTMTRLFRIYGSVVARELGSAPNFDPAAFVRSNDTLYITASPERQKEYAPLIAGLLEEIRYTTYQRHAAEEQGHEQRRPHVTFVLDEANNTAPIPLPDIVSEAGGQSLHVIVGIQDLSRARNRWGKAADGFLTLFPTKVILPGVIEEYTTSALSNASGEYDRMMTSYSESVSYVGQYNIPVRQQNPSYSMTRQKVLTQGDISQVPHGKALLFEGATWYLVNISMSFSDPLWHNVKRDGHTLGYERHQLASSPQEPTSTNGVDVNKKEGDTQL